nr:translational initiation factor 1 [Ruta chalepensis]UVF30130.1 translational initiation factor 1 [Ruta chalepensis]UVF33455.1 translational initiation factor 1 [Ruta graveolens]
MYICSVDRVKIAGSRYDSNGGQIYNINI